MSGRPVDEVIEELNLRTVSAIRREERQIARAAEPKPRSARGLEDVFWALLNSKEFCTIRSTDEPSFSV